MVGEKVIDIRDAQELELRMASWLLGGRNNIDSWVSGLGNWEVGGVIH